MGLDITAYGGLKESDAGEISVSESAGFPGRLRPLKDGATYSCEKRFEFRAGSYGGYNQWREQLAKIAGYEAKVSSRERLDGKLRHDEGAWAESGGPFWELINFYDNEGILGSEVSAKLLQDFEAFQDRADVQDDYFLMKYNEWKEAFRIASENGAVVFH